MHTALLNASMADFIIVILLYRLLALICFTETKQTVAAHRQADVHACCLSLALAIHDLFKLIADSSSSKFSLDQIRNFAIIYEV